MNIEDTIKKITEGVIKELKQTLIIMPKFIEQTFPNYKLVPKEILYNVPVPVRKEIPFEIKVPEIRMIVQEIVTQTVKVKEVIKEVPIPELKPYLVDTFSVQDVNRLKQIVELLPKVLEALEKIVKFVPREMPYDVPVPKIKEVPYEVKVPDFKLETVIRPHFQDIKVLHPVIVEQIMTLEEWNNKTEKERKTIDEIVKSQLKLKEQK